MQQNEEPVFLAEDGRRARRLRKGAVAVTVLSCLWLAGLGIGMLGFGGLPGISLPKLGGGGSDDDETRARQSRSPSTSFVSETRGSSVETARRSTSRAQRRARPSGSATRASTRRPAGRAVAQNADQTQAAPPPAAGRGWARRGFTVPPGQARKPVRPPGQAKKPATPPGQARRNGTTTTETLPPGQQKKKP